MIYGREKYELYQDTTPAKILAGLILLKLNKIKDNDTQLKDLACKILKINPALASDEFLKELVIKSLIEKSAVPAEEPVFLLRAKDPLAISSVEYWIAQAKLSGVSADRIESAESQLTKMKEYTPKV